MRRGSMTLSDDLEYVKKQAQCAIKMKVPDLFQKDVQLLPDVQQWVEDCANGTSQSLLLHGKVGVGKIQQTWAAVSQLFGTPTKQTRSGRIMGYGPNADNKSRPALFAMDFIGRDTSTLLTEIKMGFSRDNFPDFKMEFIDKEV